MPNENSDSEIELQKDESSKPSPAENEPPEDKGEEEVEEYGSRTDEAR